MRGQREHFAVVALYLDPSRLPAPEHNDVVIERVTATSVTWSWGVYGRDARVNCRTFEDAHGPAAAHARAHRVDLFMRDHKAASFVLLAHYRIDSTEEI